MEAAAEPTTAGRVFLLLTGRPRDRGRARLLLDDGAAEVGLTPGQVILLADLLLDLASGGPGVRAEATMACRLRAVLRQATGQDLIKSSYRSGAYYLALSCQAVALDVSAGGLADLLGTAVIGKLLATYQTIDLPAARGTRQRVASVCACG